MYDDDFNPEKIGEQYKKNGERAGEENPDKELTPEAAAWTQAMGEEDIPPFAGEWSYGSVNSAPSEQETLANPEFNSAENLAGANQLTSYGLDTASRVYGVDAVIKTILETDETERDAANPLGAIYQRLAPTPQDRAYLYGEIRKEQVRDNQHNADPAVADADDPKIGFTRSGDFYDKTILDSGQQASANAIRAFKQVFEMLETSEKFADLRERAATQGKSIVEYLVEGKHNPTLTDFFNKVGTEMTAEKAEEIIEELEQAANPDLETEVAVTTPESDPISAPDIATEAPATVATTPESTHVADVSIAENTTDAAA